jgi:hypothetical protein
MPTNSRIAQLTTPADIIEAGTAFCTAKCMLSALEIGLFASLAEGPASLEEIQRRHGLHGRAVRDFTAVLVILGLLEHEDGRFRNAPIAERYLVRGTPSYVGGFLERADHMLYPAWGRFTALLRTGKPTAEADYMDMIGDPVKLHQFLGMMDALTTLIAPELAAAFDWERHRSVLDIGGARGNLVGNLVKLRPHLNGAVFDLPQMGKPFAEHVDSLGLTDRVTFHAGNFFDDPLPHADVMVIGHVLHDWAPADCRMLIGKAYDALPAGGALVIYDRMIDDELTDLANLVVSLDMMLTTPGGAEYTPAEYRSWLTDTGFEAAAAVRLGDTDTLVAGHKVG